jgi:lysophospholipase
MSIFRHFTDYAIFLADLTQQAAQRGDLAALEVHIQRQTKLHAAMSPTALHLASAAGFDAVVRRLLQAGYIVHTRDYSNHTPLFLAARNGHLKTVTVLRSAGAHLSTEEVDLARYYLTRGVNQPGAAKTMELWSEAGVPLQ